MPRKVGLEGVDVYRRTVSIGVDGKRYKAESIALVSGGSKRGTGLIYWPTRDGYVFDLVEADDGWGPLLYEVAMSYAQASGTWFVPAADLSPDSKAVWRKFYDRPDVAREPLPPESVARLRAEMSKPIRPGSGGEPGTLESEPFRAFRYRLRRPLDLSREIIDRQPPSRSGRLRRMEAHDYYAVTGNRREGPFASYSDADEVARARGGYVEFAMEARDFSSREALLQKAYARGYTHHDEEFLFFPTRSGYVAARFFRKEDNWHIGQRAYPFAALPGDAQPIFGPGRAASVPGAYEHGAADTHSQYIRWTQSAFGWQGHGLLTRRKYEIRVVMSHDLGVPTYELTAPPDERADTFGRARDAFDAADREEAGAAGIAAAECGREEYRGYDVSPLRLRDGWVASVDSPAGIDVSLKKYPTREEAVAAARAHVDGVLGAREHRAACCGSCAAGKPCESGCAGPAHACERREPAPGSREALEHVRAAHARGDYREVCRHGAHWAYGHEPPDACGPCGRGNARLRALGEGATKEQADEVVAILVVAAGVEVPAPAPVPAAAETAPVLYERRAPPDAKPKPLRWHRKGDELEAEGTQGTYRIVKRKPDRRHGVLPVVLTLQGVPRGYFDTLSEARVFADHFERIYPGAVVAGAPASPAAACGPFARIARDEEAWKRCQSRAQKIGPIDSPKDLYELVADELNTYDGEVFVVVPLDVHDELRQMPVRVSEGLRDRVAVDPADVLRAVILSGASSYYVVHHHPSGKGRPSEDDERLTKILRRSADVAFGKARGLEPTVKFRGHYVVGNGVISDADTGKVYKVA